MANYPFIKQKMPQTPGLDNILTAGGIGTVNPISAQPLSLPMQGIPELDNLFLPQPSTYPNSPMDPLSFLGPQKYGNVAQQLVGVESPNLPKPIKDLDTASKITDLESLNSAPAQKTSMEDDEMKAAIERRKELSGLAEMLSGAGTIGASFAGVARPEDLGAGVRRMGVQSVQDVRDLRAGLKEKLSLDEEKQMMDPNSQSSIIARKSTKDMLNKIGYKTLADKINDNMSASQIQKLMGGVNIQNLTSQYDNMQNRTDLMRMRTMDKKDASNARKENEKDKIAMKLNAKVLDIDKTVGLSEIDEAIDSLKEYQYQPADPAMDIATLYKFIKVLDPGSVVREGEIALTKQGQSMLQTAGLNIKRITSGQVISEALRKDMINTMKKMKSSRMANFKNKVSGIKNVVKKQNIDPGLVFGDYDLEENEKPVDDWEDVK